jgi:E3 ubiquitin-protein ligase BAH
MKFGERFSEYLHGEDGHFLEKCSHVGYKRLKKVLKKCRVRYYDGTPSESEVGLYSSQTTENVIYAETSKRIPKACDSSSTACSSETCTVCDQIFFYELTKEVSAIMSCFSARARRLLHLHLASGFQRYLWRVKHFFADDHEAMIREGRHLVGYVAMNAIAIRKILKKYDKVHSSVKGRNFKTKLQAKHIELLKSPWLIELIAFQINTRDPEHGHIGEIFPECSCDFTDSDPVITCTLLDSVKLEFNLTCPICLVSSNSAGNFRFRSSLITGAYSSTVLIQTLLFLSVIFERVKYDKLEPGAKRILFFCQYIHMPIVLGTPIVFCVISYSMH